MGMGGQGHAAAALTQEKLGTNYAGGLVGLRVCLERCGKSRPHRDSISGRPARSESLYRLHYPDPHLADYEHKSVSSCNMFCSPLEVETLGRTKPPSEES
jgi:hypothetical protein